MKGKIVIDTEACKGCLFCIEACPRDMIEKSDKLNLKGYYPARVVDSGENRCTGCALCAVACPEAAIEVYREAKQS